MTLEDATWQDPDRLSGELCFRNTRVPVTVLFDHIRAGKYEDFFEDFPPVTREQAEAVLLSRRV